MKGAYWPLFLAIAALSSAVVWKYAPACVESLPDQVREMCRESTHRAMRLLGKEKVRHVAETPRSRPEKLPSARVVETASADDDIFVASSRAAPPAPRTKDERQRTEDGELAAAPSTKHQALSTNPEPQATSHEPVDPLDLPSTRGVMQADPKLATWGVVNQTTDLETLRGRDLGTIPGGRFFVIERRIRHEKGLLLAGNFWPRELAEPVQILAANLYTFSGRPQDLSERQRRDLRRYYELRGKAMDLKKEITKRWYDSNDNPHEGGDPMKDPRYLKIMSEMKACAASIPGLVF